MIHPPGAHPGAIIMPVPPPEKLQSTCILRDLKIFLKFFILSRDTIEKPNNY